MVYWLFCVLRAVADDSLYFTLINHSVFYDLLQVDAEAEGAQNDLMARLQAL